MEDKSQAWYSLLEESSPWNNTSTATYTTSLSDQAASTFISSAIHHRAQPRLSSALANSYGQILSPIHPTSLAAANLPRPTPSKISDSLTQYSINASELTFNATHKGCDSVPQSNQKCANELRANEIPRLPIFGELLNQNTSKSFKQHSELHLKQTRKDVHSATKPTREKIWESRKKASTPGSLVFPFPSDRNLHLPSSRQKRTFESGFVNSDATLRHPKHTPEVPSASRHPKHTPEVQSASRHPKRTPEVPSASRHPKRTQELQSASRHPKHTPELQSALRHPKHTPEVQSGLNIAPDIRRSFPDLFNPSLSIRAEPAGRDIPKSLNRPTPAPPSTDNKENKGPLLNEGRDSVVVSPNADMNSVIIESASKEQVRYQKTTVRNSRHEDLGASSVSSEDEMDTDISSKATGYASTLSTLLDYMSVDERVKLLPPSTLKTNPPPDPGGLSNDRDAGAGTPASTDSSTKLTQKGLSPFAEERSNLQTLAACSPVNRNVPEVEDFMMPPVGNRDNFIPVGSESNIQTKSAQLFRGVAVGGGGGNTSTSTSLGKQIDANIHITISKSSCTSDVDIDTLLPIEEQERFLPTGADSESLEKATSSSGSNSSDSEDNVHGFYQVNNFPNQVLTGSINLPTESISAPPHQLRELTGLDDMDIEGATAACLTDNNSIQTSAEDYMDVVERQKYIKTDLTVPFEAGKDLPKKSSTDQEPRFKGHFDLNQDQDKTNIAKSEPDLLLGHSSNFGICGPDLHQSIACGEKVSLEGNDGSSSRNQELDSDISSEVPSSRNPQDFANPTCLIPLSVQSLSLGDFTCPVEEEEDDTDELIKMASSVLIELPIGDSFNKSGQIPAEQLEFKSPTGISDISSTPTDNPHLSQTNMNDNVSTGTSNQLTESGRGTLGSSDLSSSPLNAGDNSKTGEGHNLNIQETSSKNQHPSSDPNAVSSKTENAGEFQALNTMTSHESLDKNSEIHSQTDNSIKSTSVLLPDSENSSLNTDLYLPLSTIVKVSADNTTVSEPNSARSDDQSQDSDVLGKQVNSLLCRTAYLEYRTQNAHTTVTEIENNEIGLVPRSDTYLMPSPDAYKFGTSSHTSKSSYTEKEGLNYDQLKQDLTDLQNGLAQGLQLKSPILQDEGQEILIRNDGSINGIGYSANSPDVLQDSKLPTNLFRRTTQQADLLLGMDRILRRREQAFDTNTHYSASGSLPLLPGLQRNEILQITCHGSDTRTTKQADLLLGMDRILRKKEQAFDTDAASVSLPLSVDQQRNEALQMSCHEGGTSLEPFPQYPLLADFKIVPMAPNMVTENKPKQHSQKIQETAFVLPNQVSECQGASSGAPLGSTQCFQHTPEVVDDLALRVERILSEEPLYDLHKMNFLDKIRPKDGYFDKLSFDSSEHNSNKSETMSDIIETSSPPVELPTSKDSLCKFPSNLIRNQEVKEQDQHFENNAEGLCLRESVASKDSSENFQVSTLSDCSHSVGSLMRESFPEAPDIHPSRNELPNIGEASGLDAKTGTFGNSSHAFMSTKSSPSPQNEEEQISQHATNKDDTQMNPVNFGHNETFPNLVNDSANSTKFLEDDVRKCLNWSNISTFSSPPKETIPVTQADNLYTQPEMVDHFPNTESESEPILTAPILDIPRTDSKRTSVISESSISSSYVPSVSRSGSISGKSATSSSHADSDSHSSNTVASVCAISAERKLHESSKLENNQHERRNSHQRCDGISSSSSSLVRSSNSSRNLSQKSSASRVSTQIIDPGFRPDELRRSENNFETDDFQKLDNNVYHSSKFEDSLQKNAYKLSLSESQPDFHPKNQIPEKNAHRSCSDINSLLHSEDPTPVLKPDNFADSQSLRRELDALSDCGQTENGFTTTLERKASKEGRDVASQPTPKSLPPVSPSMVIPPLDMEPDSVVSAVSQRGDSCELRAPSRGSNSLGSQFYESSTSIVIGKASSSSSSILSTTQSRNNSARIHSLDSALKGKKHNTSDQIQSDDKLLTNVEVKDTLDQHSETASHVSKGQSDGMEVNSHSSNIYRQSPAPPCESRDTSTSSGSDFSSPFGSAESEASHKTWTLRPYKPPGSREFYYTGFSSEGLATGESGATTLESADTGSDDAIGPQIPKEFLGSRADVPSRPGIYSRVINKKKIPVQEDLCLSTILEKSFVDDRDRSSRISERRNSQCLYNRNGYSAKGSTVEQGSLPISGTKPTPLESKARNKDSGKFCTPQRIEHLSKEDKGSRSLNQNGSLRPKVLYDDCGLEDDNIEECRERGNHPEMQAVANRSVLDLPTKNQSSFDSATTTVDTPSGFTTDPDYVPNGSRQLEPSFSSADSGQLQDISGVVGQCHPMVRYAPTGHLNSPREAKKDSQMVNDQNINKAPTVHTRKRDIPPQRNERVVRSSKELDLLWARFHQQEHSDRDSSLDSERLGQMHQLLKNPTHALVHQSLEKMESTRLKQAKVAAQKMEEQKRALLRSKIQDESSSVTGSIYSNRDLSSNQTAQRDETSISSRPSCTSDTLSSVAPERKVGQRPAVHAQGVPGRSEASILDPIMAKLRQKIDKQRKKCEQMKRRDKASEQKLRKLTHILVNRQMNDLVLAAEMSSLSTTSTASVTTASETAPKSLWHNSYKNQPDVARNRANPVSKQHSVGCPQKDNRPLGPDQNGPSQNCTGQGKVRTQGHCSRSKQIIPRGCQNYRLRADSPEIPISEQHSIINHSDLQRNRAKKKDAATMVPSPHVGSHKSSSDSEDSCYIIKSSIGIQTSPPHEVLDNSRRPNFLVGNNPQTYQSSKTNAVNNSGSTTSPHKSTSVEEVQVIPVPFMSTPKRYKNLANKALYKSSDNLGKKTSVDKDNEAWFISLSDHSAKNTHSPRQHPQLMSSFVGNPRAVGKENRKMNVRNQPGVNKKPASHPHVPKRHDPAQPVIGFLAPSENTVRTLALTNEKADDVENKITLQEAFFHGMQNWISRSRERQKRIALAAEERRYQQQMELEREEMFLNRKPTANNNLIHPFSDNLHKPKKRVLSKKEMRELNNRLYKKLPEVVERKVLLHRATQYKTNRNRSRLFSMRVQKSLLTKPTCR